MTLPPAVVQAINMACGSLDSVPRSLWRPEVERLCELTRRETLEEAARVCDEEAARRFSRQDNPLVCDNPMTQAHKGVTAGTLARAIRALAK